MFFLKGKVFSIKYFLISRFSESRVMMHLFLFLVPSKNKTDKRSIEETMKDIRERKKLKLSNREEATDEKFVKET